MAIELKLNAPRGNTHIIIDVRLTSPWTVLFGPSGSGKSSILRAIAGLWNPPGTSIRIDGQDITHHPAHRRSAPLLAQHPKLFPQKTAYWNVMFKPTVSGRGAFDDAEELLHLLHVPNVRNTMPAQLSGGEQQRVALARALATHPRLLLLDETFSGTDAAHREDIIRFLKQRQQTTPHQIISVTHDVAEAFECADEVIKLADGRIIAQGPPQQVLANERTALLQALTKNPLNLSS